MQQIGITGGIGAGKSLVCKIFSVLGIPVYDADSRAKFLMQNDNQLRQAIISEFGEKAFQYEGELNREFLAGKVFPDKEKLEKLNELVHPIVGDDYTSWLGFQKGAAYIIKEAALLFEVGTYEKLDFILLVTAPEDLRIKRIKERDGRTEKEIREIIGQQWPEERKKELADYVIVNDEQELVLPQCLDLHHKLINKKLPDRSGQAVH